MQQERLEIIFYVDIIDNILTMGGDSSHVLVSHGLELLCLKYPNQTFSVNNKRIYRWNSDDDKELVAEVKLAKSR